MPDPDDPLKRAFDRNPLVQRSVRSLMVAVLDPRGYRLSCMLYGHQIALLRRIPFKTAQYGSVKPWIGSTWTVHSFKDLPALFMVDAR